MKPTLIALIGAGILIGGSILFTRNTPGAQDVPPANNVTIVDGQQIIDIRAKGGFTPRISAAKAGIPTVLRFHTSGTFDCSSFIRIPSMGISKNLPSTGTIDIAVATPQVGPLQGMCGMGMYPFQINFQG